jgi:hypothetical protein
VSNNTEVAAAYQVTARLLASEQQTIWSRTQNFLVFNTGAAALIAKVLPEERWSAGAAAAGFISRS